MKKAGDLPIVIHQLLIGLFFALMAVAFIMFWQSAYALFMVVISLVYLMIYVGTPYFLYRINSKILEGPKGSIVEALECRVSTFTGVITGTQAMVQVLLVPIALLITFCGMGIIMFLVV